MNKRIRKKKLTMIKKNILKILKRHPPISMMRHYKYSYDLLKHHTNHQPVRRVIIDIIVDQKPFDGPKHTPLNIPLNLTNDEGI